MSSYFDDEVDPVETAHCQLNDHLRNGNVEGVRAILKECPDAIKPIPRWQQDPLGTLLWSAFGKPQQVIDQCIELLVKAGADPHHSQPYGKPALKVAIEVGKHEFFKTLVETGSVNLTPDLFHYVNTASRNIGRPKTDYPLLPMYKTLLEADTPYSLNDYIPGSFLTQFIKTHVSDNMFNCDPHPHTNDVIKLIIDHGEPVTLKACEAAIKSNKMDQARILLSHTQDDLNKIVETISLEPEKMAVLEQIILEIKTADPTISQVKQKGIRL